MVLRKLWRQQLEPPAAGWTLESSLIGVAEVKPLLLRMVDAASDPAFAAFEGGKSTQPDWRFWRRWAKMPPIVDLLFRAATVSCDALGRAACGQADILFKPALETIDLLDWKACDRAIDAG